MALEWSEAYETQIRKVDEQHQQLFRFANKLEELIGQEAASSEEVEQLLHFLKTYAESHFRYEEACMAKRRCPAAKKNRLAHQTFMEFYEDSTASYRENGFSREWLERLNSFIQDWLHSHICAVDIELRHCRGAPKT
ncbi:hemerythrin family protein [Pelagicoccus sp. SDUM812003]|uniref:bacteriohemerythrin n=1 Tax=Pelagicoccus sp. SDUM812003 TaxID=3041267 RepID=UPI00281086D8|nr:hemerythrin family protein [Pelagicoccus sp. SDUM812003]MDQ8205544.1 hemerythrin family protein [Pelagicoccus sp. SDUM812003]